MSLTETLSESNKKKRGREELVLRFFAAKDGTEYYHGNVAEWLNSYMEAILLAKKPFDYQRESGVIFERVFVAIDRVAGDGAFCKYKNGHPIGGLAPAYYEAIVCGFARQIDKVEVADPVILNSVLISARESANFKSNVGTGANKRSKLAGRIDVIEEAIKGV